MNKNIVLRIAAIVLMCTLVTACFASSTFAKYTSKATGSDEVAVAKWSITAQGDEIAVTGDPVTVTINLFEKAKVSPMSSGTLSFSDIKNNSDVPAKITIKVSTITNDTTNPVPITLKKGTTELKAGDTIYEGTVNAGSTLKASDISSVAWEWLTTSDDTDTKLGVLANSGDIKYSVTFTIAAEQTAAV